MATPIESLLNLKKWEEDEAKNRFAMRLKELAVEEGILARLEQDYALSAQKVKNCSDEPKTIDKLQELLVFIEGLLYRIHSQEEVIKIKGLEVERARLLLTEATKERKTFEKLDERQKDIIKKDMERKEQKITDEHASARHGRKQGGETG
ncbi:MAG: flagellar export protein FliJ [Nitrospirae bacterium]|nr:MAG: flagellar export protein FliJ [Nitrospirota bacterium]